MTENGYKKGGGGGEEGCVPMKERTGDGTTDRSRKSSNEECFSPIH